jgi:hypothetical protein
VDLSSWDFGTWEDNFDISNMNFEELRIISMNESMAALFRAMGCL